MPASGRDPAPAAQDGPDTHESKRSSTVGRVATTKSRPFRDDDDALDLRSATMTLKPHSRSDITTTSNEAETDRVGAAEQRLTASMPTSSTGLTTIAYQKALQNRINESSLFQGGKYDTNKYTPTFIHDILMLPGSLANLLGLRSPEELMNRLTPALLPGYNAHVHAQTLQPCLLSSIEPETYVQGLVVFGLGKDARAHIHQHYRPHAKRRKLQIEIDVAVREGTPKGAPTRLRKVQCVRRVVNAHVWLWSGPRGEDVVGLDSRWTLEDYLEGRLGPAQTALRVETYAERGKSGEH